MANQITNKREKIVKNLGHHDEDGESSLFRAAESDDNIDILSPMTMEDIVENVFQYLHLKDLKICRFVHSTWERQTLSLIKKKCLPITFNQDNSTNKAKYKLENMTKLVETMKNSRKFPYCKFDIETDLAENPYGRMTSEEKKILGSFYQTISNFVCELTVRMDVVNPFYIGEQSEKLEFSALKVLNIDFRGFEEALHGFNVIQKIVENAPVLEKISFGGYQNFMEGTPESAFIKLMENSKCETISCLEICGYFTNEHLVCLNKMGLRLKKVYINLFGWNVDFNTVTQLFESQRKSLSHLVIEHCDVIGQKNILFNFPRMDKLTSLEFKTTLKTFKPHNISFSKISYLNQFPVLKRLSIESNIWEQFFGFNIQPVGTVEALVLNGPILKTDCILHAARLFPKLKTLEIPADINVTNIVYNKMQNIEELVFDTKDVESVTYVITGYNSGDREADSKTFEREFNIKLFEFQALSSLKKLKILRLKGINKDVEMDEVACRFLIMKMDSLQCLDFCGRAPPRTKISEELLEEMRKKFLVLC